MSRDYSYTQLKKIDWPTMEKRFRKRASDAKSPAEFIKAITPMCAQLKDGHVWIVGPDGKNVYPHQPSYQMNFSFSAIKKQFTGQTRFGKSVLVATIGDDTGYVLVGELPNDEALFDKVVPAVRKLFDRKGIIVDLRMNKGGSEPMAQKIASLFVKEKAAYARSVRKNGPKPSDFGEPSTRWLVPAGEESYSGRVACLIGPGCVSSGEGMAMMMKAAGARLFGQNTRGSSGNPAPVTLPNGVKVFFSRWVSQLPDGTAFEEIGIKPDERIPHKRGQKQDPTFQAALKFVRSN